MNRISVIGGQKYFHFQTPNSTSLPIIFHFNFGNTISLSKTQYRFTTSISTTQLHFRQYNFNFYNTTSFSTIQLHFRQCNFGHATSFSARPLRPCNFIFSKATSAMLIFGNATSLSMVQLHFRQELFDKTTSTSQT